MNKSDGKGVTLRAAQKELDLNPWELRGAMLALKIKARPGRSEKNRMAMLITPEQLARLKKVIS